MFLETQNCVRNLLTVADRIDYRIDALLTVRLHSCGSNLLSN